MKVIEFLGMARAGKTTQINLLKKHLQKQGFKVAVLTDRERASSLATPPTEGLAYTLVFFENAIDVSLDRHTKTKQEAVDEVAMNKPWLTVLARSYKKNNRPKLKTLVINGWDSKAASHERVVNFIEKI